MFDDDHRGSGIATVRGADDVPALLVGTVTGVFHHDRVGASREQPPDARGDLVRRDVVSAVADVEVARADLVGAPVGCGELAPCRIDGQDRARCVEDGDQGGKRVQRAVPHPLVLRRLAGGRHMAGSAPLDGRLWQCRDGALLAQHVRQPIRGGGSKGGMEVTGLVSTPPRGS